jgi:hypothetical protein
MNSKPIAVTIPTAAETRTSAFSKSAISPPKFATATILSNSGGEILLFRGTSLMGNKLLLTASRDSGQLEERSQQRMEIKYNSHTEPKEQYQCKY